jgi:hypothetical protein
MAKRKAEKRPKISIRIACKCGQSYYCRRCHRWVPNGWVCAEHAEEAKAKGHHNDF